MRYKQDNIRKKLLPGIIPLAMILLILLVPTVVEAAQYYVWGRVYSAAPLAEGAEVPPNPLEPLPSGHNIIGDNLVAQVVRNLVKVKVVAAGSGSELGKAIVTYDGGYLVSFTSSTAPKINVKFVVEELATTKILMESEAVALSPWQANNIYYLLVPESLSEIDSGREFATRKCTSGTSKYTGIFTRVGKIEVETEVSGSPVRLIDPGTGLVTVPKTVATQLKIHRYNKAPLGGNLYMFGAFSQKLYKKKFIYYQIKITDKSSPLSPQPYHYMNDPLYKTKYTIDLAKLKVKTERIKVGPHTIIDSKFTIRQNCYMLTPLSTGTGAVQEFWSFPDLLALWRTGTRSGKYQLSIEIVNSDYCEVDNFTNLTVMLDNVRPLARILPLDKDATGTSAHLAEDTPLIYTPGPAVLPPYNLGPMLGTGTNYAPKADPACSILEFTNPSSQHLAFKLSAYHSTGYMRYWYFAFTRNKPKDYKKVIGKFYNGTNIMQDYSGLKITTCSQTGTEGFQDKYLYLNPGHLDLVTNPGCGYRFVIWAATRATDGYNYLYWSHDEDIHYLKK
jgi:hypothetical protein